MSLAATAEALGSEVRELPSSPRGSAQLRFDPPDEAVPEPESASEETPTVLTKLQKWGDYESVGQPVQPSKFVPMKTPMSHEIIENWSLPQPPRHSLTVASMLAGQAAQGRRVGMIIDLANHSCLYEDDIPPGLAYAHIQLIAKVLPGREAIDEVVRTADAFWEQSPHLYVGIHCAYGFNRTGFVVCSYLCQACGLTVPQALAAFAAARPPGVKHDKFISELYRRYGVRPDAGGALAGDPCAAAGQPGSGERPGCGGDSPGDSSTSRALIEVHNDSLGDLGSIMLQLRTSSKRGTASLSLARALCSDFREEGSSPQPSHAGGSAEAAARSAAAAEQQLRLLGGGAGRAGRAGASSNAARSAEGLEGPPPEPPPEPPAARGRSAGAPAPPPGPSPPLAVQEAAPPLRHPPDSPEPGRGQCRTPAPSAAPPEPAPLPGSWRPGFVRSTSIDSDNPSLGFGAREALQHLRDGADSPSSRQALEGLFTASDSESDPGCGAAALDRNFLHGRPGLEGAAAAEAGGARPGPDWQDPTAPEAEAPAAASALQRQQPDPGQHAVRPPPAPSPPSPMAALPPLSPTMRAQRAAQREAIRQADRASKCRVS